MSAQPASWGRWPPAVQQVQALHGRHRAPSFAAGQTYLAHGMGRSYGDSCLNDGGTLLLTRGMDRFIAFDARTGVLECEAGATLADIIALVLPHGWFLPVTPGTQFVTIGGAIANDVHGKNHHRAGSFGRHVLELELLRSDGEVLACSPAKNAQVFAATVGGLGLTGLIRSARIQLARTAGPWIRGETIRFACLEEFFELSRDSDRCAEYTVAWVDTSARGARRGRGHFSRGNACSASEAGRSAGGVPRPGSHGPAMPFTPPFSLVNPLSVRAFNALYYARQQVHIHPQVWDWRRFFYPLDNIRYWNRMYGPRGFFQYQCVVPPAAACAAVGAMLERIAASGEGSFLAVLKMFGELPSPGMLSFARPGATLAVDFPNRGTATLALLDALDAITREAGGAVYPAKDARMSVAAFRQYFPRWREFTQHVDPAFSSSFWRRVTAEAA